MATVPSDDPIYVVIDTSIFVTDFHRRSNNFRLLFAAAARKHYFLVVPALVIQELVTKFREHSDREASAFQVSFKKTQRLIPARVKSDDVFLDTVEAQKRFEQELLHELNFTGVVQPDLPAVTHESVVARILDRKKPSRTKDQGYRDTLLWETVKEFAAEGRAILISGNTKDFSDEGKTLAAELVDEVVNSGFDSDRVTLRVGLKEFLAEFVQPDVDALEELATLIEQDEGFRLDLLADVQRLLEDEIGHGSPVDYAPKKYDDISDPQVAALIRPVVEMHVGYGRLVAKDELLFEIIGSVPAEVEFFLPKWELWSLQDDEMPEIEDADWNDQYALVRDSVQMEFRVEGRFSRIHHAVDDLRLDHYWIDSALYA